MRVLLAMLCGSVFGLGLLVSGMTDTAKVQGFLDVAGAWDATLMFVLGGAIMPMLFAWRIAAARDAAVLGGTLPSAPSQVIDTRLIGGSALFGFGWALVGLCPGPAMASLSFGGTEGLVFFVAMALGMALWRGLDLSLTGRKAAA